MSSEYMYWAKTNASARFNLANSGVADFPLRQLPVRLEDLELSGPSRYGYEPLQQAIARKCGVPAECVFAATGTSLANHLAMAAVLRPGDEVLLEHPAYEPLLATARYLGARVRRFARRFEDQFSLECGEVERGVTPRTRLIVLTNLHNPSSARAPEPALEEVGAIARRLGAQVLVDEVYLDAAFASAPRSAIHLGDEFIVSSSLTKVYGLSGLRCGWVLAEPELVRRLWRLNDLFGVIPAHAAERLSVIALEHLERIAARAKDVLAANRQLLRSFVAARDDLEGPVPAEGTVAFFRARRRRVDELCRLLRERYDTTIVPGRFFEMPDWLRIGIGADPSVFAGGVERLGAALDELNERPRRSAQK